MKRVAPVLAALSALASLLGGCDPRPDPVATQNPASEAADTGASRPAPSPSASPTAEMIEPARPSASREPREVLAAWAKAVELRDWRTVRSYWGDSGARSGMDETGFALKWSDLIAPEVSFGDGEQDGAAGSLYYTAPVTINDGKRVVRGQIVLRRVNDVPGATPEQLRWHIESTTLAW